jgi:hypothetical protein
LILSILACYVLRHKQMLIFTMSRVFRELSLSPFFFV